MKKSIVLTPIFFSLKGVAQQLIEEPDKHSIDASERSLKVEYTLARECFRLAIHELDKLKDIERKNESLVGLAAIPFLQGEYSDSLKLFNSLEDDYMKCPLSGKHDLSPIDFAIRQWRQQILAEEN